MIRGAAVVLAGLAVAGPAGASGSPPAAAARCDGPELACAVEATPAFGPDGALWLAWTSATRVYVGRSADRGRSFAAPVEVTPAAARLDHSADTRPQLVIHGADRVTVAYAVMTDVPFKGEILYAHSQDGGRTFPAPRPLDPSPAGKRFLALAPDPDGTILAAWIDKRGLEAAQGAGRPYAGAAVFTARSRDGGATFGQALPVQEHTCECCRIAVAHAGAGRPVLLWRNLFGRARDHALATLGPDGTPGPVHRLSRDDWEIDACPHHGPALAVSGDGRYHAAWFTAGATRQGLFYARSADGGATFTAPLPFGDPRRQPARPQLLAVGSDLWLAWREFDGRTNEVVAMVSRDGGQSWGSRQVVAGTDGPADHPVLIGAGPRAFVSWLTRADGYRLVPLVASAGATADAASRIESSGSP